MNLQTTLRECIAYEIGVRGETHLAAPAMQIAGFYWYRDVPALNSDIMIFLFNIFAKRPILTFTERRAIVARNYKPRAVKAAQPAFLCDKVANLMQCTSYNSQIDYSQTI